MHPAHSKAATRPDLCAFYKTVRSRTEELCYPLEIEDLIPQPSEFVSPIRWNIAHTTWFFEEMVLRPFDNGYEPFDPEFSFLFNSYYNALGARTARDQRGNMSRPTVKRVFEYRKYVDEAMLRLLERTFSRQGDLEQGSSKGPGTLANGDVTASEVERTTIIGLNHEQQHQELLLTDIKYTFSLNPLFPVYRAGPAIEELSAKRQKTFVKMDEGLYEIGHRGDGFCFDNELARHKVYLNSFEIATEPVTNLDYLKFMLGGGYTEHRYWHSEGWDWVDQNNVNSPLYWREIGGEWFQFTLSGLRKLRLDAPVCHVSFYEAAAYAEWREMRLPTEFEWEAASSQFEWGLRWEWTDSAYLPYPGFRKPIGAIGEYNGKFMINQMVLRGASVATADGHSRNTYRNFFHPHLRWQFTGIRLVRREYS